MSLCWHLFPSTPPPEPQILTAEIPTHSQCTSVWIGGHWDPKVRIPNSTIMSRSLLRDQSFSGDQEPPRCLLVSPQSLSSPALRPENLRRGGYYVTSRLGMEVLRSLLSMSSHLRTSLMNFLWKALTSGFSCGGNTNTHSLPTAR